METDFMNDKHSIKNLLFYRAIPNYVIPIATNGHKVYSCTDCCDKFVFRSSYEQHITRKSVKISYTCRHCNERKIFYNRCNLLAHIRSHAFKTATINVSDLQIEPLPLSHFIRRVNKSNVSSPQSSNSEEQNKNTNSWICFECKIQIKFTGSIYKERAKHYTQFTNKVFTCPVCLFALPTPCGLRAHLRLHTKVAPFFCPECGHHLSNAAITYPYTHHCDGFKMMRATTRVQCLIPNCNIFHPNDIKDHYKNKHVMKVYKCQRCFVACLNEQTMQKHIKTHDNECRAIVFYQCVLCPGRLVVQDQTENHLKAHNIKDFKDKLTNVYPCWACSSTFTDINPLLYHHINNHTPNDEIKNIYQSVLPGNKPSKQKPVRTFRVIKKCDICKRSFTYRCKYDEIPVLPTECPFKCTPEPKKDVTICSSNLPETDKEIICPLCKKNISENWEQIKQHFSTFHKAHRCIDIKISSKRLSERKIKSIIKPRKRRRRRCSKKTKSNLNTTFNVTECEHSVSTTMHVDKNNAYSCKNCEYTCDNKEVLERHIVNHRDPCMAYQCMECGQSFVVKKSFSTHLLLEHNIDNVEKYIAQKQCYNKDAFMKCKINNDIEEPLRKNQCQICREQYDNPDDLEKHFRVHGMAFLLKKTSNKIFNSS